MESSSMDGLVALENQLNGFAEMRSMFEEVLDKRFKDFGVRMQMQLHEDVYALMSTPLSPLSPPDSPRRFDRTPNRTPSATSGQVFVPLVPSPPSAPPGCLDVRDEMPNCGTSPTAQSAGLTEHQDIDGHELPPGSVSHSPSASMISPPRAQVNGCFQIVPIRTEHEQMNDEECQEMFEEAGDKSPNRQMSQGSLLSNGKTRQGLFSARTGNNTFATRQERANFASIRSDRLAGLHASATKLVLSQQFDYIVCGVIALNAVSLGVQANHVSVNETDELPSSMRVVELAFAAAFTAEIVLRLFVFGRNFFTMPGWGWNWFDFSVVGMQLFEEGMALMTSAENSSLKNISFVRILKMMRLVRVIRLARILRLIHELRVLVSSIVNSLKSLLWTMVLLFMLIYAMSIAVTELVAERCLTMERSSPNYAVLRFWWGSLPRAMLSLFEATTGGVDWDDLVSPLIEEISPLMALLMVIYVGFATLAMMNVVTGIFVDSVLTSSKEDRNTFMLSNAREIFKNQEHDMELEEFLATLKDPRMMEFLNDVGVSMEEATGLFHLLDTDESGTLNADEFLQGCVKLRAPIKGLDAAVLVREVRKVGRRLKKVETYVLEQRDRHAGRIPSLRRVESRANTGGGGPGGLMLAPIVKYPTQQSRDS